MCKKDVYVIYVIVVVVVRWCNVLVVVVRLPSNKCLDIGRSFIQSVSGYLGGMSGGVRRVGLVGGTTGGGAGGWRRVGSCKGGGGGVSGGLVGSGRVGS